MKSKTELYTVILTAASEKEYLTRPEIHQSCREAFSITDEEWDVQKQDGSSLYANRIDFAKLDLRISGLVEPYQGRYGRTAITPLDREALAWPKHELCKFVQKKTAESRHNGV